MTAKPRTRLAVAVAASTTLLGTALVAGERTWDFTTDPTTDADPIRVYQEGFFNLLGEQVYYSGTGGNPGGFLGITWPIGSSSTIAVFPDIDDGKIVTAFKMEMDLRVGSPRQNERPADGFSINFARSNDDVLLNDPPTSGMFATSGAVETGTRTGLSVIFDTWAGNQLPDGGDIEGIIVRVDNVTVLRQAMPTRNGTCEDDTSLQTGPRNTQYWIDHPFDIEPDAPYGEDSWTNLCWQRLSVELDTNSQLTVIWKGRRCWITWTRRSSRQPVVWCWPAERVARMSTLISTT
jgi:hypothetical protein